MARRLTKRPGVILLGGVHPHYVATEPVSLGLVRAPGDMGADIVAAEGQAIGNSLNSGGPCLRLFATRE